jgi:phosphoribosylformylglycinamidine synthase
MRQFFRKQGQGFEWCYNVETSSPLDSQQLQILTWLLAETFEQENFGDGSFLQPPPGRIVEIGPRLNFQTPWSTNSVAICHAVGLTQITRIERSRRYLLTDDEDIETFVRTHHDRMTEMPYQSPLTSFDHGLTPPALRSIDILKAGKEALTRANREMGLGMDDWDVNFYVQLFLNLGRNPTEAEIRQLGSNNSEHSRHWFFKGQIVIDGVTMPVSLLDLIRSTLKANPSNSLIAFSDNSSAIRGFDIWTIVPACPGQPSPFTKRRLTYHFLLTAETHNFPCGIAPIPGGETGTGGRIRDVQATGQGALVVAATCGFCTGNLRLKDWQIPGEENGTDFQYPSNLAPALAIMLGESYGGYDYGNKFGEPVIVGFTRTFGLRLPNGERYEWLKPIMFTGGIGQIADSDLEKAEPQKQMLIIQIGGPAFRIGLGGGAASSVLQGDNLEQLDFDAVQRGDAETEQKMNRVIRACVELGEDNPIAVIHDQGAGGPSNVLTELVHPAGGRINIRKIKSGDPTLSVAEIWVAEYQERNALLIRPEKLEAFQLICEREKVACEILGEITGDGQIVVYDEQDGSTPVNLSLPDILGHMPDKTFIDVRIPASFSPLVLPEGLTVAQALELVFRLPAVGSKNWAIHRVDQSVTGLIARSQCCGRLQLPVADVGVIAQSHFGLTGAATSIGEQPIKMLLDAKAGARLAVAEALTNMVWAQITGLADIKCSVNWMWPAKLPGEAARIYDAAEGLVELMIFLGIAADGGKDSLSMATRVDEETVKAPGQVVVSTYAAMNDISRVITPDLKRPGESRLLYISLSNRKFRLGGSALAQAFGQIGDESPDIDDPQLLKQAFLAIQELISRGLILAGHDVSDGGLITCLAEMIMAGNCGLEAYLPEKTDAFSQLFAEEAGLVLEFLPTDAAAIESLLENYGVPVTYVGRTTSAPCFIIRQGDALLLNQETRQLRLWWEATSDRLNSERLDTRLVIQDQEAQRCSGPVYGLSFVPETTPDYLLQSDCKPKVAVIREEGSNGDREMTSAFFLAGFEPWDVTMSDLLAGRLTLDQFRGIAFVGGFSYADVLDSAKGWAAAIRFNSALSEMFERFYQREDTFSLGVCNGCQLMALLGWVPSYGKISEELQPRFIHNESGLFESRWLTVRIQESPAIMLADMSDSTLGIFVAHGEGRLHCPDPFMLADLVRRKLAPIVFVDDQGKPTEHYPENPNGSPLGITALCSENGRHLAMMPHPERAFLKWQWPWLPPEWQNLSASPWLKLFQNARTWCENH